MHSNQAMDSTMKMVCYTNLKQLVGGGERALDRGRWLLLNESINIWTYWVILSDRTETKRKRRCRRGSILSHTRTHTNVSNGAISTLNILSLSLVKWKKRRECLSIYIYKMWTCGNDTWTFYIYRIHCNLRSMISVKHQF